MNKKAAIEMSIGTIVVIVIAITMLILGLVFVRSIMCSGIRMSEKLSEGAENKIKSLIGEDEYGVKCEGVGGQEIKLASGGRRPVVCAIKTEESVNYNLVVKEVESLKGASTKTVEGWVLNQDWEGNVAPGGNGEVQVVLLLDIPKDAPTTLIKLIIEETKDDDPATLKTHTSFIDIVPSGFFRTTMC